MSRFHCSLRSRLLEVMGAGKNGASEGDKRENRSFFCAHYFQAPATQAVKQIRQASPSSIQIFLKKTRTRMTP